MKDCIMDIFQRILQNIYFKNIFYRIPPDEGTRRTPPRKIPPRKTPTRRILPRQIPPWWISPGIFPRRKLPHGKLPCIYQCILYASFFKNEAWTCHWIKFSFACFLKIFWLHSALWISSNCESVGSLVNIG